MPEPVAFRVAILSRDQLHGTLLKDTERGEITNDLSNDAVLDWVPPRTPSLGPPSPPGFTAEAAVLVFIAFAASPMGKKFQELIAEDSWKGLKRLVSRILKRQNEVAYRVVSFPYVVLETPRYTLALGLAELGAERGEVTLEEIAKSQDEALSWYATHWEDVLTAVRRHLEGPFDFERADAQPIVAIHRRPGGGVHAERHHSLDSLRGAGNE